MFSLQPQPSSELIQLCLEVSDSCPRRAGGVTATSPCRGRGMVLSRGRQDIAFEGLPGHWESHPRSRRMPAPEPPASPTLASPSVSMMTMEVLLSGTLCSSRALFSMLMALSSASLMLVTGTQTQTAP